MSIFCSFANGESDTIMARKDLENVLRNLYCFLEILQNSRREEASVWDKRSLENALKWSAFAEQASNTTHCCRNSSRIGNSPYKLRLPRSDACSAEQVVVVVDSETSICTGFLPLADIHFEVITDGET